MDGRAVQERKEFDPMTTSVEGSETLVMESQTRNALRPISVTAWLLPP